VKGKGTRFTLVFLAATVAIILGALIMETSRGPTFRAADHADMGECVRNIPREWRPGSLEYTGAESACYYIHVRNASDPPREPGDPR
jgi:hypothetical protein